MRASQLILATLFIYDGPDFVKKACGILLDFYAEGHYSCHRVPCDLYTKHTVLVNMLCFLCIVAKSFMKSLRFVSES